MKIKTKLLRARKALGLTQPQLAKKLGVSPRTIWAWEAETVSLNPIYTSGIFAKIDELVRKNS